MTGASAAALTLSALPHTWLIDVDGTVVQHNGHKHGGDVLLPGVREFWRSLPHGDVVVLLSARSEAERPATLAFFEAEGLRFDMAIFGLPVGERVLINDTKPSGMITALAMCVDRDEGLGGCAWRVDPTL